MYGIECEIQVYPHYQSHAYAAHFGSGCETNLIFTFDGVGDGFSTTVSIGESDKIEITHKGAWPESLGGFYTAFTNYLGFHSAEGEYKLMGMAAYGEPTICLNHYMDINDDGSRFKANLEFWDNNKHTQVNEPNCNYQAISAFTGINPIRQANPNFKKEHFDLAASVQTHFEKLYIKFIKYWQKETGIKNIVLSGGCALNCIANMKLVEQILTDVSIYVQPAASDRGLAIGNCYQAAIANGATIAKKKAEVILGRRIYSRRDIEFNNEKWL